MDIKILFFSKMRKNFLFIIYIIVGVVSAAADTYSLHLLNEVFYWSLNVSITVAFVIGLLVNYILHSFFTFKRKVEIITFLKYLAVVALNYMITLLLVRLLVYGVNVNLIVSKIIILPVIAAVGFVLSKTWIYRE